MQARLIPDQFSSPMNIMLTRFEIDVLNKLLCGSSPILSRLREQLSHSSVSRELTGVGFYLNFSVLDSNLEIPGRPTFHFGDVQAEIQGLAHGAGFILFVSNGYLEMLEGYSYEEPWPNTVDKYALRYGTDDVRDFATLEKLFTL